MNQTERTDVEVRSEDFSTNNKVFPYVDAYLRMEFHGRFGDIIGIRADGSEEVLTTISSKTEGGLYVRIVTKTMRPKFGFEVARKVTQQINDALHLAFSPEHVSPVVSSEVYRRTVAQSCPATSHKEPTSAEVDEITRELQQLNPPHRQVT